MIAMAKMMLGELWGCRAGRESRYCGAARAERAGMPSASPGAQRGAHETKIIVCSQLCREIVDATRVLQDDAVKKVSIRVRARQPGRALPMRRHGGVGTPITA